jgi:hypothetical protein
MEGSDACRQNCDKVDVKVHHSTSIKLCKGVLRGDPMRGPLEHPANTNSSYVYVSEGGKLRKAAGRGPEHLHSTIQKARDYTFTGL